MSKSLLMALTLGVLSAAGSGLQAQVGMTLPGAKHVVVHSRSILSQNIVECTGYIDGQRIEKFVGYVPMGYRFVVTEIEIQAAPANISMESSVDFVLYGQATVYHTNGYLKAKPFGEWITFHQNMSSGIMFPQGSNYGTRWGSNNIEVCDVWLRGYYSPVPKTVTSAASETLAATR